MMSVEDPSGDPSMWSKPKPQQMGKNPDLNAGGVQDAEGIYEEAWTHAPEPGRQEPEQGSTVEGTKTRERMPKVEWGDTQKVWLTAETGRALAKGVEGSKTKTGPVQCDLWEARGELGLTWRLLSTPFV